MKKCPHRWTRCPKCGKRGCKLAPVVQEWDDAGFAFTCGQLRFLQRRARARGGRIDTQIRQDRCK